MRYMVRCSRLKCQARRVLTKHPDHYQRLPKCQYCGNNKYRVDRWEMKRKRRNTCYCDGYHFPHHKAQGDCHHNPKLEQRMKERYKDEN